MNARALSLSLIALVAFFLSQGRLKAQQFGSLSVGFPTLSGVMTVGHSCNISQTASFTYTNATSSAITFTFWGNISINNSIETATTTTVTSVTSTASITVDGNRVTIPPGATASATVSSQGQVTASSTDQNTVTGAVGETSDRSDDNGSVGSSSIYVNPIPDTREIKNKSNN